MAAVGLDPARIPEAQRDDIDTFIELHIEQGPLLEEEGLPVGVVDRITGIRHYVVELGGRSDHAGARPMDRPPRPDGRRGRDHLRRDQSAHSRWAGPP